MASEMCMRGDVVTHAPADSAGGKDVAETLLSSGAVSTVLFPMAARDWIYVLPIFQATVFVLLSLHLDASSSQHFSVELACYLHTTATVEVIEHVVEVSNKMQ